MSVCAEQNIYQNNHFSSNDVVCNQSSQLTKNSVGRLTLSQLMSLWLSRSRQRKALAKLDDRMIADIGCTSAQVKLEINKPFWK